MDVEKLVACAACSLALIVSGCLIYGNAKHSALTKLCNESDWGLPTCVDYINEVISNAKGTK